MKRVIINFLILLLALVIITPGPLYSQNPILKAGISKVDITPSESLYMGGYDESCRAEPSQGNHGNIYIRALVLDDNLNRIAFVEIDVVSLPRDNYDSIRKLISVLLCLRMPLWN